MLLQHAHQIGHAFARAPIRIDVDLKCEEGQNVIVISEKDGVLREYNA
jgi:hypothetical protein